MIIKQGKTIAYKEEKSARESAKTGGIHRTTAGFRSAPRRSGCGARVPRHSWYETGVEIGYSWARIVGCGRRSTTPRGYAAGPDSARKGVDLIGAAGSRRA